jgi:hypothetical protein
MTGLKLGLIPDDKPVKLTVTISSALEQRLVEYAQAYSAAIGREIDHRKLVPHMLDRFMRTDRAFKQQRPPLTSPSGAPREPP